jgi:hypothetical protein
MSWDKKVIDRAYRGKALRFTSLKFVQTSNPAEFRWYDFSVKRLSVTALIALYTLILMWNSVDRTYTWAAIHSAAITDHSDDSRISVNKPKSVTPPHQLNRRILESQFVVEPPVAVAWIVLTTETMHQTQNLLTSGTGVWQTTGRAPPRSS